MVQVCPRTLAAGPAGGAQPVSASCLNPVSAPALPKSWGMTGVRIIDWLYFRLNFVNVTFLHVRNYQGQHDAKGLDLQMTTLILLFYLPCYFGPHVVRSAMAGTGGSPSDGSRVRARMDHGRGS
jgi:hypothetical protein